MSYEIKGKAVTARIYSTGLEEQCNEQIKEICDNEFLKNEKIRIMPDAHWGKSICIGFTSTISGWSVPNFVGVDINCGVISHKIGKINDIDFKKFDNQVKRSVPSGKNIHHRLSRERNEEAWSKIYQHSFEDFLSEIKELTQKLNFEFRSKDYVEKSIGTLGGGNHFVALNKNKDDEIYITIHSGSRNLGLKIAEYYQSLVGKEAYLSGQLHEEYLKAVTIAADYARLNRMRMLSELLRHFNIEFDKNSCIETVHNYIDTDNMIIRKGAISAQKDELCLIPINMADGTLLCRGKGNPDWNYSAPHGAGRLLSRNRAYKELSLSEYKEKMQEKNVWSSCVTTATIDESPMAYKSADYLKSQIGDSVEVLDHWSEIYNFKAIE
jgi:RNA-splicing ligase RtcB